MAASMIDALKPVWRGHAQEVLPHEEIDGLLDLPSEHAAKLAEYDWRLVRFMALRQPDPKMVPDIHLSLGKPAYRLDTAEWAQDLAEGARGHIEAFGGTAVGPMLHAMRFGFYTDEGTEHETSYGICDATEIAKNSFATSPSRHGGEAYDFSEEEVGKILLPEEFAAIDGLYEALAGASQKLFDASQPV